MPWSTSGSNVSADIIASVLIYISKNAFTNKVELAVNTLTRASISHAFYSFLPLSHQMAQFITEVICDRMLTGASNQRTDKSNLQKQTWRM